MANIEVLKADEALGALRDAEVARGRAEVAALAAETAVATLAVLGNTVARTDLAALNTVFDELPVGAQGLDLATGAVYLKRAGAASWGDAIGVLSFQSTMTLPPPAPTDNLNSNEWAPFGAEWAPFGSEWAPA